MICIRNKLYLGFLILLCHPAFCLVYASETNLQPDESFYKGVWRDVRSKDVVIRLQPTTNDSGRWAIDPDGIQIGGDFVPDLPGQGAPLGQRGSLGSIRLNCHPYGNYDAGACVVIADTSVGRESSRMGIGAALEQSNQKLAAYQSFENVGLGILMSSPDARLILSDVTYDKNRVWMPGCNPAILNSRECRPLHPNQLAQLRTGMTITTNSVDSTVKRNPIGESKILPLSGLYHAFIGNWDVYGRYLEIVPGWIAYGGESAESGQVPSLLRLDHYWTNYNTPTVFLGSEEKEFGQVSQIIYNPTLDSQGIPKSSLAHYLEYQEVDMVNYAFHDYEVSVHGLTLAYSAPNGKKPTYDSYGLFIAGGFGHLLRLTGNAGEEEIDGTGVKTYAPATIKSVPGSKHELSEVIAQADGNRLRLVTWENREKTGNDGWHSTSVNLGLFIDGRNDDFNVLDGAQMASISWNHLNNVGGLDVINSKGVNILSLQADGKVNISGDLEVSKQSINGAYSLKSLPLRGFRDGAHVWCTDCRLNGIRGVEVFWHSSVGKWLDVNNKLLVQ